MGHRILIADDSRLSRSMLSKMLKRLAEFEIVFACDGQEALDALRRETFRMVFLDLTMPNVSGFEVLEIMREEGIEVPVTVVSADVQPHAVARVEAHGARFIAKRSAKDLFRGILAEEGLL